MASATNDSGSPSLFNHTTRKDWGVGVLAWEDGGKRGYLFEDGEERTMASGFHQLMRRVEQPNPEQKAAYDRLRGLLAARENAKSSSPRPHGPSFLDQLSKLHETYPTGLVDPKWLTEVRGEGVEKRTPRHRDAAIREVEEVLSASALDALISNQRYTQVWELVVATLSHTDLVPTAQLKKPKAVDAEHMRVLALAVRELLHGKTPFEQRFDRFLSALASVIGESVRWEMATALISLAQPTEHICVHPTVFRHQLKATGSRGTAPARPTSVAYARMLGVARLVAKKLGEQGQVPRDLLDVHDFMRVTFGPPPKVRPPAKLPKREAEPVVEETTDESEEE